MIASLHGKISQRSLESVIVDVNGVGYEVFCSTNTLTETLDNSEVTFWIHTVVRQDAIQLFGFSSANEKQLFLSLIKVNGVGPKVAMNILCGARVSEIVKMIENEDVKGLSKLPKIGKKTAEQMILSLRGKLVSHAGESQVGVKKDLFSALVNLGFRESDVQTTVAGLSETVGFDEGLRNALQALSGQ